MMRLSDYTELYKKALLDDVLPFWERHSPDRDFGGYFTCLDREGKIYDTDKFVWLQARQVWTFSMLYNKAEKRQSWLDMALLGAEFLLRNGRDGNGHWYFSLTREGEALTAAHSIFSDCFATMAFGQLYKAVGKEEYGTVAVRTFENILRRRSDPKGKFSKSIAGTRPLRGFAVPMILSNLVLEIESLLDPSLVEETLTEAIHSVMELFYHEEYGVMLENTDPDGKFVDCFEGRLINPGHGLEAMWFMMELAARRSDAILMRKVVDIAIRLMEYGWDQQYGGLFYFLDVKGAPPQQLEWDQKLWWVHQEATLALLKGYLYTKDSRCRAWFEKLHEYTWRHFPDPEYGEWFGYLNRQGEVLLPLKGGKWKGCFHGPRFLYQGWKTLEAIGEKE